MFHHLAGSSIAVATQTSPTRLQSPHLVGVSSTAFHPPGSHDGQPPAQLQQTGGAKQSSPARPLPSPDRVALGELSPGGNPQLTFPQPRALTKDEPLSHIRTNEAFPTGSMDDETREEGGDGCPSPGALSVEGNITSHVVTWCGDHLASCIPTEAEFLKQQRMAAEGVASACFLLAECHRSGHFLPCDPAASVGLYRKAGKKGNPDALFAVGGLYESGEFAEHGIPKNTHKALKYLRLAAAMGHGDAAARLRAYGVRLSRRGSKQSGSSEVASSTRSYTRQPSASTYSPLSASPERSPGHSEGLPSLSGFSLGRQSSTLSARSRKPNPISPYKLGRRISRAARKVISKAKRVAARIGQRSLSGKAASAPVSPTRVIPQSISASLRKTASFNSQA